MTPAFGVPANQRHVQLMAASSYKRTTLEQRRYFKCLLLYALSTGDKAARASGEALSTPQLKAAWCRCRAAHMRCVLCQDLQACSARDCNAKQALCGQSLHTRAVCFARTFLACSAQDCKRQTDAVWAVPLLAGLNPGSRC